MSAVLQPLIDNGMPPDEVAAKVLDAIRADRFWILPHDDADEHWASFVNERTMSQADRTNPTIRSLF